MSDSSLKKLNEKESKTMDEQKNMARKHVHLDLEKRFNICWQIRIKNKSPDCLKHKYNEQDCPIGVSSIF